MGIIPQNKPPNSQENDRKQLKIKRGIIRKEGKLKGIMVRNLLLLKLFFVEKPYDHQP